MDPEAVSRLKIGNFRDGQGFAIALHAHVNLGTGKVESGTLGEEIRRMPNQEQQKENRNGYEAFAAKA
jgi:hypothetical protein